MPRWSPEERSVLEKLKTKQSVADVKRQVDAEVRKGLQSYVGLPDTKQNRLQAEYYVRNVCEKYTTQYSSILEGQAIDIKLTF